MYRRRMLSIYHTKYIFVFSDLFFFTRFVLVLFYPDVCFFHYKIKTNENRRLAQSVQTSGMCTLNQRVLQKLPWL